MRGGKGLFLFAFLTVVGIITVTDIKDCHELPWPPRLIGAGIAFGFLDMFSIVSEDLSNVLAIGIVIAFIVNGKLRNCDQQHAGATAQPVTWQDLQNQSGQTTQ